MKKIYTLLAAVACVSLTTTAQDLRVELDTYTNNQVIMGSIDQGNFANDPLVTDFTITNDGDPIAVGDTIVIGLTLNGTLYSLDLTPNSFNVVPETIIPTGGTYSATAGSLFLGFPSPAVAGDQATLCVYASLVDPTVFANATTFDATYNGDLTPANNMACVIYEFNGDVVGLSDDLKIIADKAFVADGQLIIENNSTEFNSPATINIVNITGQVVQSEEMKIQKGRNVINLNDLSAGIYVVSIEVEGEVSSTKVMVQ